MAELLKDLYSKEWIASLGKALNSNYKSFDDKQFLESVLNDQWSDMPLKRRTAHLAECINKHLDCTYEEQVEILKGVVPQFNGLTAIVFPTFVEFYGLAHYETSIEALLLFTQFSTAEFAIRPFIVKYPETILQMLKWTEDPNKHIRRLASEGCRPLLPWAMKLKHLESDPSPIISILENLRNDSEDYVYRSVANNLNDISKSHPELVLNLCKKWVNESPTTQWVCKHALRTLLKKGSQDAMILFGFGSIKNLELKAFEINHKWLKIGDSSHFSVELINNGKSAKFRLEYAIGYVKKMGKINTKVFQLRELTLNKGESLELNKKIDFKDLSTRKHYPGTHSLSLIANGQIISKLQFTLK